MDLIATLINAKNADKVSVGEYLSELIKYEKLARNDKFKHITESPLLQKQMSNCWEAFSGNTDAINIVINLATAMAATNGKPLAIVDDLKNHYSKRQLSQLEVIGRGSGKQFSFYDLSTLSPYDLANDEIYVLSEREDNMEDISIIICNNSLVNVYTGHVKVSNEDMPVRAGAQISPFKNDDVTVFSYSNQGNNDYDFAKIGDLSVSMPDSSHIRYKDINGEETIKEIDAVDIINMNLHKNDLNILSNVIKKYA